MTVLSNGKAELTLAIRDSFAQNNSFVHGGVISYLADNCITLAVASIIGVCVTAEYKINYVRPAICEILPAKSKIISSGQRQAVCECRIYVISDGNQRLVAVAHGTIVKAEK